MKKNNKLAKLIKFLLLISLLKVASPFSLAENKKDVYYLEEAMKPLFIAVNDKYCYIGERFSVFQYTLKEFKFVKKFGGKGQGPGQFPVILDMHTTPGHLVVSSLSRVYIYSSDGNYIAEKKTNAWSTRFDMEGVQFLGMGSLKDNKIEYETIELLNDKLSKKKEIYRSKKILQSSGPINPLIPDSYFCFIGGKILVNTQEDSLLLFNSKGDKEKELNLNLTKQPISEKYKKHYFDSFKKNPRKKIVYDMIKNRIKMPDYFPVIKFIRADNRLIYLVTYQEKDQKFLCLVLDLSGKELARTWIPLPSMDSFCHPLSFHNGSYYYMKDDIENEKWMVIKEQIYSK